MKNWFSMWHKANITKTDILFIIIFSFIGNIVANFLCDFKRLAYICHYQIFFGQTEI